MWLFIEPLDVWLFRDGRPFDAGADHRARSLFPPNPTTVQGALRAKVLELYGVDLNAYRAGQVNLPDVIEQIGQPPRPELQRPGTVGNLRLRGPFLARNDDDKVMPYFPCPADVVITDRVMTLHPEPHPLFSANWPEGVEIKPLVYEADKPAKQDRVWFSADALSAYLRGKTPEAKELVDELKLFARESRFGVGIDDSVKRPDEGMLYQVEYIRPADHVGLLVEVHGLEKSESLWRQQGLLALGGESRAARYTVITRPAAWPESDKSENGFKLYLATPTWLGGGWQASQWSLFFDPAPRLVSAALGKPQFVGGWDVANNRQKPMRRYVPAGSVYYFEGQASATGVPVCDDEPDRQIGFGQYFSGRW
jgi:CRISPR-associated protein Cmr3